MIYYKAVRNIDGLLWSINRDKPIRYQVGKWVKPKIKGSRLFVFDTLQNAEQMSYLPNIEVYECEANGVIPARYQYCDNISYENRFKDRWTFFNRLLKAHKAAALPFSCSDGTLFAKSVKLIRKIS